jgi:hypothetical protein
MKKIIGFTPQISRVGPINSVEKNCNNIFEELSRAKHGRISWV